ncbi:S41 family peptidase [Xanthomonas albilineans]|uniref:Putative peptidase_s41 protein n=2 Tax=Xanthomonas albilineans TaxID=29447 RepID=D2UGA3_XANAP|nr:S41 family peptidase [Xanthomonas albilineans]CBA17414.1 putative peptidase_s41 protein [Xanthomonas albilineans GPE PC73]
MTKYAFKRRHLLVLMVVAVSFLGIAIWINYRMNLHKFVWAWSAVNNLYYDDHFNGYDWGEVRETYEKKIPLLDFSHNKTTDVIKEMLELLESSHLTYFTPSEAAVSLPKKEDMVGLLWPNVSVGAGILMSEPRSARYSLVKNIEPASPLYLQGVREGWHIFLGSVAGLNYKKGSVDIGVDVVSPGGNKKYFISSVPITQSLPGDVEKDKGLIKLNKFNSAAFLELGKEINNNSGAFSEIIYVPLKLTITGLDGGKGIKVIDVVNRSSAERAGVVPGDEVIGIKPASGSGQKSQELNFSVKNAKGDIINLVTEPNDSDVAKLLNVKITERTAYAFKGSWVIKFNSFNTSNATWVAQQVSTHPGMPIIIDLRFNNGGVETSIGRIAGNFLPPGILIGTKQGRAPYSDLRIPTGTQATQAPVEILVSEATASAAEVLAATLQHYGRARIVGTRTSGQVLIARLYDLGSGAFIHIPVASFKDPSGISLERRGVMPDYSVMNSLADIRSDRDAALECAAALNNGMDCSR